MKAEHYPPADYSIQRFDHQYSGKRFSRIDRLVIHTTEGTGWPPYDGGASAPTFTARPGNNGIEWRQHFPANMSARALRHPSGTVDTNNLNVAQVELVGTCDKNGPGFYWPHAGNLSGFLEDLAALITWLHQEWELPLNAVNASRWLPYPKSYGNTPVRMSEREWVRFHGVCGHQHVPNNTHGDPGNLDITTIMRFAVGSSSTFLAPSTTPQEDDLMAISIDELKALMETNARRTAELVTGLDARNPVIVPEGQGNAQLKDGRDIIAIPTALQRILEGQDRQETLLRQIRDALNGGQA